MQAIDAIYQPILSGDDRPDALKDYPVVHVQPVAWGEMDAFNHLNNVIYYRYAESARISYMRAAKLTMHRSDLLTILASSSCQYLRPVTYPDTLLIGVRTKKLGNTSLILEYAFVSHSQRALVATGESVIVRTNEHMQKTPWSDDDRQKITILEQTSR